MEGEDGADGLHLHRRCCHRERKKERNRVVCVCTEVRERKMLKEALPPPRFRAAAVAVEGGRNRVPCVQRREKHVERERGTRTQIGRERDFRRSQPPFSSFTPPAFMEKASSLGKTPSSPLEPTATPATAGVLRSHRRFCCHSHRLLPCSSVISGCDVKEKYKSGGCWSTWCHYHRG
ncbi:hypothetical protein PIB30_078953 [Stylosanthes scabra]|uniref:Uncharacterized protein n=1 Tax=Stylosanthes scabra TaxID=79078 RepID=A0ABU6XRY0_9FABA|nr:hypothetical protein [Stylosanthes scabra]